MGKIPRKRMLFFFMLCFFSMHGIQSFAQQDAASANAVHDKMYHLMQQSRDVTLPSEVIAQIQEINKNNPYKAKTIDAQLSFMKVLYNSKLPKADINFFGKQLLLRTSEKFTAIRSLVNQRLHKQ